MQSKKDGNNMVDAKDHDLDGDIDQADVKVSITVEKADAQRRMAWVALTAIVAVAGAALTPWIPLDRLDMFAGIADMFFIACAGVVGAYMGTTAWMTLKSTRSGK